MMMYGGGCIDPCFFFNIGTSWEWPASLFNHFISATHRIRGWVGPRCNLEDMEKGKFFTVPGLELHPVIQTIARFSTVTELWIWKFQLF
jgi:hypothetical protein